MEKVVIIISIALLIIPIVCANENVINSSSLTEAEINQNLSIEFTKTLVEGYEDFKESPSILFKLIGEKVSPSNYKRGFIIFVGLIFILILGFYVWKVRYFDNFIDRLKYREKPKKMKWIEDI